MSSVSVPADERSEPRQPRGRVYRALVGRRIAIGALSCLYVGLRLAARNRWPWAVQYVGLGAVVVVALLCLFAPPGIFSPKPGA